MQNRPTLSILGDAEPCHQILFKIWPDPPNRDKQVSLWITPGSPFPLGQGCCPSTLKPGSFVGQIVLSAQWWNEAWKRKGETKAWYICSEKTIIRQFKHWSKFIPKCYETLSFRAQIDMSLSRWQNSCHESTWNCYFCLASFPSLAKYVRRSSLLKGQT